MTVKKFFTNNLGLKATALFLAFFVWAMITGKERAYTERTLETNVECFNVGKNIDIRTVRPEKVQVTVRGTSRALDRIDPRDFRVKIDLKDVTKDTRLDFFTRDYLQAPEGIQMVAVYPRMIEVTVKEFITKEVNVRVRYKGDMQKGIRLISRKVVPDKVKVFGYKSQIDTINQVEGAEMVNLSEIVESTTIKIPLKKEKDILRFEGPEEVDVRVEVENRNKKQDEQGNEE